MINKLMAVFSLLTAGLMALTASVQADDVRITPTRLTPQIYMLAGEGGNIGLFIGPDGTFLIDDQYAPLTDKIVAAIKSVGGDYPRFLINTHYHGDHTGGNENLGKGGTLIFSHDNVRERLLSGSFIEAFNMKRPALGPDGLPVVTFGHDLSFHLNGDRVRVIHTPHAHTDGDSLISFSKANVIHAGDLFFNGFYPFIDVNHGGTLKGMIKGVDTIVAMADDDTKIIPGHGPLADKADLLRYRDMLVVAHERLARLKAAGKSPEQAIAAKPLVDLEETWGNGLFSGERWIEVIYSGI